MKLARMLKYSAALEAHNDRAWFHENHKAYEEAKGDFAELLESLRFVIADSAPALADDILYMQAKDWTYRTAKDMRYNRGKLPYNPAFRAYISPDKKSWMPLGYYLSLFPGRSIIGTGVWSEKSEDINRVRDYILENYDELYAALSESGLEISGDKLKRVPKGWPEEHPAAELLKHKNWQIIADVPDAELADTESLERYTASVVKRMEPLRLFLMTAARSGDKSRRRVIEDFYGAAEREYLKEK